MSVVGGDREGTAAGHQELVGQIPAFPTVIVVEAGRVEDLNGVGKVDLLRLLEEERVPGRMGDRDERAGFAGSLGDLGIGLAVDRRSEIRRETDSENVPVA